MGPPECPDFEWDGDYNWNWSIGEDGKCVNRLTEETEKFQHVAEMTGANLDCFAKVYFPEILREEEKKRADADNP